MKRDSRRLLRDAATTPACRAAHSLMKSDLDRGRHDDYAYDRLQNLLSNGLWMHGTWTCSKLRAVYHRETDVRDLVTTLTKFGCAAIMVNCQTAPTQNLSVGRGAPAEMEWTDGRV